MPPVPRRQFLTHSAATAIGLSATTFSATTGFAQQESWVVLNEQLAGGAPELMLNRFLMQQVYATIGPQDAEQTIFGQLQFGMDHAELLSLVAPRPICVCATTRDFFPIAGAKQAYARTNQVYARLGWADRTRFVEDDEQHTWSEPLRIASVQWMSRWLRGVEQLQVPNESDSGITAEQMRITPHGQVVRLPGARSIYDLMRDEAARLERQRQRLDGEALQHAVRRRAGIRPIDEIPEPVVQLLAETTYNWGRVQRLTIALYEPLPLPALLLTPDNPNQENVLWAHGEGKNAAVEAAISLAKEGRVVLAVDLTGFGETQGHRSRFYGSEAADEPDAMIAYALGKSLVGMRAEDLLGCGRWLAQQTKATNVQLYAASWAVTPAVHAAVAEPDVFSGLRQFDVPMFWGEVIRRSDRHRYSDVVHGGMIDYTLEQLQAAVKTLKS